MYRGYYILTGECWASKDGWWLNPQNPLNPIHAFVSLSTILRLSAHWKSLETLEGSFEPMPLSGRLLNKLKTINTHLQVGLVGTVQYRMKQPRFSMDGIAAYHDVHEGRLPGPNRWVLALQRAPANASPATTVVPHTHCLVRSLSR